MLILKEIPGEGAEKFSMVREQEEAKGLSK